MNARRYVMCGAVSVAMHSLALSAQQAPIQYNMNDADTGNRVAIQLIAAHKRPVSEPEVEPELVEEKKETEKPDRPPIREELKPDLPKPKPIEKKVVKQEDPLTPKKPKKDNPVKQPPPKDPVVEEKQKERPKPQPEKQETKQNEVQDAPQDNQVTQVKENSPLLVERPTFKVRPTQPQYPRIAKRRGMEGTVLIEVWLDENGDQTQQSLLKSSGFDVLDNAALEAVKKWQFNGHEVNGVALAHRVRVPIRFNLD